MMLSLRVPTVALVAMLALPRAVFGQVTLSTAADFLAAPGDRVVATLNPGARVVLGVSRQGFTAVTLEGFVDTTLLGAARDSFPRSIHAPSGAVVRAAASATATAVAKMSDGAGLNVLSRSGRWARIRRTGWVSARSLPQAASAAAASAPRRNDSTKTATAPAKPDAPDPGSSLSGAIAPRATTSLRAGPDGVELATLKGGTPVTPLAHQGAWTRVRVEGWVRDTDMVSADTSVRTTVSAADLRADPDGTRGIVLQWTVQYLALQTADALRRDLRVNEPYILARGPADEEALLYIAVPPALLTEVKGLEPLSVIAITARVRAGRSAPSGLPLLDLISLARR